MNMEKEKSVPVFRLNSKMFKFVSGVWVGNNLRTDQDDLERLYQHLQQLSWNFLEA